jgi:hypothetical protein
LTPTIFGAFVVLVGGWLMLRGSLFAMLVFVLFCTLMGGSATVILTALGNSSIPPANLALLFFVTRCLFVGREEHHSLGAAGTANRWLALFAVYGAAGAMILPRLFAGSMAVTPLRPNPGKLLAAEPLHFTNQNITVSVYIVSTLVVAICATMAVGRLRSWRGVANTAAAIGVIHALLGLGSVALASTPLNAFFLFFRNGFYAQLEHRFGGLERMSGIFPEASIYALYGFTWLVFLTEMWLRGVEARRTGRAALLLLIALVISTSTTAYVGLAAYGGILGARLVLGGRNVDGDRRLMLVAIGLIGVTAVLALAVAEPRVAAALEKLARLTTVDKLESGSAEQRTFWAKQGLDAFVVSNGLGIGVGSFRSSSIVTAILGCTGLIGFCAFAAHLLAVFMPLRRSTWGRIDDPRAAVGAAASWTALMALIPAAVSAPSPDPGLLWGLMAGMALGLRGLAPARAPQSLPLRGGGNQIVTALRQGPVSLPGSQSIS